MSSPCPCGSGQDFETCCQPYIAGTSRPVTAEALMRSRYTAYTKADIDYIKNTTSTESRKSFDEKATRQWAASSEWMGFQILKTEGGSGADEAGVVEFIARYKVEGKEQEHHEIATFKKDDGQWFFEDGRIIGLEPYRRPTPKIGRNEPCSCGSGLKYKKCCGAKAAAQ